MSRINIFKEYERIQKEKERKFKKEILKIFPENEIIKKLVKDEEIELVVDFDILLTPIPKIRAIFGEYYLTEYIEHFTFEQEVNILTALGWYYPWIIEEEEILIRNLKFFEFKQILSLNKNIQKTKSINEIFVKESEEIFCFLKENKGKIQKIKIDINDTETREKTRVNLSFTLWHEHFYFLVLLY